MDSKRFFFYYFLYYFLVGAIDSLLFGLTWNAPYVNFQQQITDLSNPASFLVAAQAIIPISGFFSIFAMFFSYLLFQVPGPNNLLRHANIGRCTNLDNEPL